MYWKDIIVSSNQITSFWIHSWLFFSNLFIKTYVKVYHDHTDRQTDDGETVYRLTFPSPVSSKNKTKQNKIRFVKAGDL